MIKLSTVWREFKINCQLNYYYLLKSAGHFCLQRMILLIMVNLCQAFSLFFLFWLCILWFRFQIISLIILLTISIYFVLYKLEQWLEWINISRKLQTILKMKWIYMVVAVLFCILETSGKDSIVAIILQITKKIIVMLPIFLQTKPMLRFSKVNYEKKKINHYR